MPNSIWVAAQLSQDYKHQIFEILFLNEKLQFFPHFRSL